MSGLSIRSSRARSGEMIAKTKTKEPKSGLEGRDWVIENYEKSDSTLQVDDIKMNQNVCIRDCKNISVQVTKKINNVTIENCTSVNVVMDSVISAIDIIRSGKCQVQVLGRASAVTMDNCQGIHIYVSLESKAIQITSSQNAEINLHVPESESNADNWVEIPVPCQFVHTLQPKENTITTKVSDLYG